MVALISSISAVFISLPSLYKLLRSKSRILGSSAEFPRDHSAHSQFESQLPRESCLQWPNLLQRPMSCQLRSNRPPMRLLLGLTLPLLNVLNPGNPMGHAVIPATMKMVMNEATLLKPMGERGKFVLFAVEKERAMSFEQPSNRSLEGPLSQVPPWLLRSSLVLKTLCTRTTLPFRSPLAR